MCGGGGGWRTAQAEAGLKTQETINKMKSVGQSFHAEGDKHMELVVDPAAKSQGTNEFNRYLLCLLEDKKTKEEIG